MKKWKQLVNSLLSAKETITVAIAGKYTELKDSYVSFQRSEMYLQNAHIGVYKPSSNANHEPERKRKLLMKRHEIEKLEAQVTEKGLSIVPLKVYFSKGLAKVEIALVRGKKKHDKRDAIKERDVKRQLSQAHRR